MSVGGYGSSGYGIGIITDGLILSVDPYNTKSYVSGGTVYDLTVNRYTGETVNGVVYNNAWSLDGTNDSVRINSGLGLSAPTLPMTIDLWFKLNNFGGVGTSGGVIVLDSDLVNYYGLNIQINKGTQKINFNIGDGAGNSPSNRRTITPTSSTLTLNKWYHISCVFRDAVTFDITPYIDLVVPTLSTSGTGGAIAWSSNSASRTRLGESWGPGGDFSDIDISQVKVYNRELSFDEITQNYNALKWRFR